MVESKIEVESEIKKKQQEGSNSQSVKSFAWSVEQTRRTNFNYLLLSLCYYYYYYQQQLIEVLLEL